MEFAVEKEKNVAYLLLESGIFDAELLLVESHLPEHGRTSTVRADNTPKSRLQPVVLALEVLVLRPQHHIIGSVLLRL